MTPIQQLMLGAGKKVDPFYIDDVFSTYLYTGNATARSINTGIDMTENGLVWIKNRDQGYNHSLQDTVRGAGATKKLSSNLANAENSVDTANHWAGYISAFNNNGFSIDKTGSGAVDWANYNKSGDDYSAWTFRKSPMFDVVTYTGNGTAGRPLSHSLGSVPGLVLIKQTSSTQDWVVYHRSLDTDKKLKLNGNSAGASTSSWNSIRPTSTTITLGAAAGVNATSHEFVAYVFAGGESTNALARSVDFDGNDYFSISGHSDLGFGTGDFTWEAWLRPDIYSTNTPIYLVDNGGFQIRKEGNDFKVRAKDSTVYISTTQLPAIGQWTHVAITRSGTTLRLFYNGLLIESASCSHNFLGNGAYVAWDGSDYFNGKISNLRSISGTAVYTSSFKPPTEPLTNITNTKLLCCNNSSTTGSTVTPSTISSSGDPTASTDSPFDDPAGFVFGENEDQNVIKCGSYDGNGLSSLEVYVGWEPQWILTKRSDSPNGVGNWFLWDSMRGIKTDATDNRLSPNLPNSEHTSLDRIDLTSTGFKVKTTSSENNGEGCTYSYICIRRPDPLVQKPAKLGTDVFAIDTWVSDSAEPAMISNFPVDFVLDRDPTVSSGWEANMNARGRLIQNKYLKTNSADAEATGTWGQFGYNNGWLNRQGLTGYSDWHSWMWKRHAGFDVVTYKGNGSSTGDTNNIPHGLNQIPEMAWIKSRGSSQDWGVYHKDMHSSIPQKYYMKLNTDVDRTYDDQTFDVPSASHFNLRHNALVNANNDNFLMMLFASVEGISKCDGYSGQNSAKTVDCGFVPRFVWMKKINATGGWFVFDTVRGISAGNDCYLELNSPTAQDCNYDVLDLLDGTQTGGVKGFSVPTTGSINDNGSSYIYYAHA